MKTSTLLGAGVLALALTACGQKSNNDFSGATPDVAGLTLEVQGGTAEGLPLATVSPAASQAARAALAVTPDGGD